jgi:hypothetical protein
LRRQRRRISKKYKIKMGVNKKKNIKRKLHPIFIEEIQESIKKFELFIGY